MVLDALVVIIGELIASDIIDQIKVPEKAYIGYGIPVSAKATVFDRFNIIQTSAVAIGVINNQIIPK